MACTICGRTEVNLKPLHMSLDRLQQVSEKLQAFVKVNDTISMVGLGEPLLYPKLEEAIELMHTDFPNNSLVLNTNALNLGKYEEVMLQEKLSNKDILVFSVNASNEASYQKYMNSSKFKEVCGNINTFLQSWHGQPKVYLRYLKVPENNFSEFKQLWLKKDGVVFDKHPLLHWRTVEPQTRFRYPCPILFAGCIVVDVLGDCYPCCNALAKREGSSLKIGNILDANLKAKYAQKLHVLQALHKRKVYPRECLFCDFWKETPFINKVRFKVKEWLS